MFVMRMNFDSHRDVRSIGSVWKENAFFPIPGMDFGDATVSGCNRRTGQSHKSILSNTFGETPMVCQPLFWTVLHTEYARINSVRRLARPAENTDAASQRRANPRLNCSGWMLHAHSKVLSFTRIYMGQNT